MAFSKIKQNLTEGPLFTKMFLYVLPIMATAILQLLYNMADHMVVGQFSGDQNALAAIGSTTSLTNLIVNLFMGITAGTGVVIARNYGAKDYNTLSRAVHTSLIFALLGGIAFSVLGLFVSSPALTLMKTKPEILDSAVLYMRIILLGVPATAVYNFGATILRSVGDSKTPLFILSASGIINVLFNLFFVIVCNMSVDGVATATIISQYISATAVVFVLYKKKNEPYAFSFKKLSVDTGLLKMILRYGIPAGIQSSLFSISNVMLTSASNNFPTTTISAKTIAGNIDSILYASMNSYLHASMTFTAQNYGAMKPKRIKRSIFYALTQVSILGITLSALMITFAPQISSIFIEATDPNKDIIIAGVIEMFMVTGTFYVFCGIMETLSGALRGLGYSMLPMIISIGGICGIRLLWIFTFFPMEMFYSLGGLYVCYPISWGTTALVLGIVLVVAWHRTKKLFAKSP